MIERDVFGLASAVSADSIPGVNDLAPETASSDQHGSLDSVGCHLGELLQPDACGGVDRPLEHRDNLVSDLHGQRGGHIPQHLAGGVLIPCGHAGVKG